MLDIPKSSNGFWAPAQGRATPEQTPHSPVGTLQPRRWEHIFSSHFGIFLGAQKISTGAIMGILNGSNGPIYINNIYICGHFDISDHMSSPLAMVRIIMGGSGPFFYSFILGVSFITDPVLPVAKKMPKSDLQKTG